MCVLFLKVSSFYFFNFYIIHIFSKPKKIFIKACAVNIRVNSRKWFASICIYWLISFMFYDRSCHVPAVITGSKTARNSLPSVWDEKLHHVTNLIIISVIS